jgi:uncharacterized RDD family membrane protein YckC
VSGGDAADEGRRIVTVQAASASLAPAAVLTRVIAYIIDVILLAFVLFIVGMIVSDVTIVGSVIRAIIFAAVGFGYFAYTWVTWRASPGQRVLGLMTVNAADGAALTWNQATMRWAFLFGPSILNSLFPVGGSLGGLIGLIVLGYYIYLLYTTANDPRKQGLHDKQASSLVTVKAAA